MHPLHLGFLPEFDREKYLYHYTSMDTAIKYILKNRTLLFNPLANVNDPMESNPNYWAFSRSGKIRDQLFDYFDNRTKTVCFSQDVQGDWGAGCCPTDFCARGHSKPRMWATYGDNNEGVCLIFDKELLRLAFENGLNGQGRLLHGAVRYGNQLPADARKAAITEPEAFEENFEEALLQKIEEHHDIYFFYKYVDWSTENEYRFVITGGEPGKIELGFGNALVGVVVGVNYMKQGNSVYELGEITQDMGVPGRLLSWNWGSAGGAPINEVAKEIGPRVKAPQE